MLSTVVVLWLALVRLVGSAAEVDGRSPSCDPGFGFPVDSVGCPTPQTGWLTARSTGDLVLEPFRTYGSHRVHDVAVGEPRNLALMDNARCTGIILVGYREPLADHTVACDAFGVALREHGIRIPVAVWRQHGRVVQVSELYRP